MLYKTAQQKKTLALDLGTTKFCLAALRSLPTSARPSLDMIAVPATGMRRGMLANTAEVQEQLLQLLDHAENQFGCTVDRVIVGVAGSHLQGKMIQCQTPLTSDVVSQKDLHTLTRQAEQAGWTEDREILHVIPLSFRLDGRDLDTSPLGNHGKHLAATFFLIDADKYYLKDVVQVCNQVGLQVAKIYSEPFASASVTVPDHLKTLGVAVIDIGGGTTDGVIFQNGRPVSIFTVNIGGHLMTQDLAVGLNTTLEEAEKLKLRFGMREPQPSASDPETLQIKTINGATREVSAQEVQKILGARVEELGYHIVQHLRPFKGMLGGGLLLTGGGAGVSGIDTIYQRRMNIPVRRSKPLLDLSQKSSLAVSSKTDGDQSTSTPALAISEHPTKYATVLGLINLEIGREQQQHTEKREHWPTKVLSQFVNWLKELS